MKETKRNPIYQQLATDLERRIRHGQLEPGERLPSLKELCQMYQISYKTAFRLYSELTAKGHIYSINGKGYFVSPGIDNQIHTDTLPPITEILMFDGGESSPHFHSQFAGAAERAEELGLSIQRLDKVSDQIKLTESTGVILRYTMSVLRVYQRLEYRRLRVVMTNNYFPELHCVVCDNMDAIRQIVHRLTHEYGCRKLLCCGRHFTDLGQANLSEREYAFTAECERMGIENTLLISGDMQELFRICADPGSCPDGIVFISNTAARTFYEEQKKNPALQKIRYIYFASGSNENITGDAFTFSSRAIGRMAVDLLVNFRDEDWMLPNVHHIQGYWKSDIPDPS